MLNEEYTHNCAVSLLPMLEQTIQAAIMIQPTKGALDFPALSRIAFLPAILGRPSPWFRDMVVSIRRDRNDSAATQGLPMWLTVITFIQAQAFGASAAFADANVIDCFQQVHQIMSVRFTQAKRQRMPIRVNDQVAFQPFNPVFSRETDLIVCPFLDSITLAS